MSKSFIRTHYQTVTDRLNEPRKLIQAIYGPRQVGKTTVVTQVLRGLKTPHLFVSADDTNSNTVWIDQQWNTARERSKQLESPDFVLVIDEI